MKNINSLAVHTVGHPTMTGDTMAKVFDVEGTFETGRKKASEWCNQ